MGNWDFKIFQNQSISLFLYIFHRGGGRYVKLVVLLYIEPTKNVGGAKGCILSNLPKVGGAIAPPAPPVPPPLPYIDSIQSLLLTIHYWLFGIQSEPFRAFWMHSENFGRFQSHTFILGCLKSIQSILDAFRAIQSILDAFRAYSEIKSYSEHFGRF